MIATAYNYAGHTIYTDGRVYKNYILIGQYKTDAAAKAAATRNQRAINAQAAAEHHISVTAIRID